MFALLFRNRWFAVGYVVLTLVSASLFVGRDGGADRLAQTTRQLKAQRAALSAPPPAPVPTVITVAAPTAAVPALQAVAGSDADPAHPRVGDVFINPLTGQRVRAVRREDAAHYQPAFPDGTAPGA
jgi:hypothetical protein